GWAADASIAGGGRLLADAWPPSREERNVAWIVAGFLATVFVILPWLAETAATPALRDPMTAAERADRLGRAAALAPWDARYPAELGRTLLASAFTGPDPVHRADDLAHARAAFERA